MSTIPSASPRPSLSSRRTSTSTTDAPPDRGTFRRNKAAALRDYYGIKSGQASDTPPKASLDIEKESEIDRPSFSASSYVDKLLKEQDLAGIMKMEAVLVKEIWGLDGEKKALVYDNYSKLIGATETIKNMRERMETRRMETSTLTPAIGHIAETASALSNDLFKKPPSSQVDEADVERKKRNDQQGTVRWVLACPRRIDGLVERGKHEEAEQDWKEVSALLDRWSGVRGVEDVRKQCLQALRKEAQSEGGG